MFVTIATAIAAANGAPTLATQGVALRGPTVKIDKQLRDVKMLDAWVDVISSAGSGVMTVTARIWGYHNDLAKWAVIKTLNAGVAIAETGTDTINYAELVFGIGMFDRVYAEVTALAGTTPAFDFHLHCRT